MASRANTHRILSAKDRSLILPLALVDRWPDDRYVSAHVSLAASLKANVADAVRLQTELQELYQNIREGDSRPVRAHNKQVTTKIRTREKWLDDVIKYSDYPAMVMASYPDSEFMDRGEYREIMDTVDKPVLARGIAAGWILDNQRARGLDYYFIETGYLGNYPGANNRTGRKIYHRICHNEMQQSRVMKVPDDRWRALVEFNPALRYHGWRLPGSRILLVTPSEKPCKYYGIDRDRWVADTMAQIRQHTDRDVVVRDKTSRWNRTQQPIYEMFDQDIWCVVTYNSIAAVEAVAHGIPAFALAPTAAAAVTSDDLSRIEDPYRPDPQTVQQWLHSLAYGQFQLDELISGEAWRITQENLERETLDI